MAKIGRSVALLQENAAVAVVSVRQDLSGEIESLHASVQSRLVPLEARNFEPIHADIFRLQQSLEEITQRLEYLPPSAKVDSLSTAVNQLQMENQDLDQRHKGLDAQQRILHCQLDGTVNTLTSLQEQVGALGARFDDLESEIKDQAQEAVPRWAQEINQRLQAVRLHNYQLVSNRNQSRNVLLEALESAQERLIIVCPWLTRSAINSEVIRKFRAILNRNCQIDIGWGHLSDTGLSQPIQLCRQQLLCAVSRKSQGWKYNTFPELEQLEQEYRSQFRLKLLGTHEKYLVCDRSFAMLGSHNFLTSGTSSSEREVGLQTNDPRIIEDLIERFESAENLELPQSNIVPPVIHNVQILRRNLADMESANAALNF